jgi:predicted SAM-dependent methyltransferase
MKINYGCGMTPTKGWLNYDNSISLLLSKIPLLPYIMRRLRLINEAQYQYVQYAKNNHISYGDATRRLCIPDESAEVLYSSHMIEHLDKDEADKFINEVYRVLKPGGVIRIAVPDIKKQVDRYYELGDADAFIGGLHCCMPNPKSLSERLRLFMVGSRNHLWMYDGSSLCRRLEMHGFVSVEIMPAGKTKIFRPEPLDLYERNVESVYVEAERPAKK